MALVIEIDSNQEKLTGADFFKILEAVKSCSNRKYIPDSKLWKIELTEQNLELIKPYFSNYAKYVQILKDRESQINYPFLFPFQVEGVKSLMQGRTLLADSVGLGKTVQSAAYCEINNFKRVLVVCPAPLKRQWSEELIKFFNKQSIVLDGTPKVREKLFQDFLSSEIKYLIVNYEQLNEKNKYLLNIHWDCCLYDEVHRIKNYKSIALKFARKIKTTKKIGMTATPLINNLFETNTIANFLNYKFMDYNTFESNYCVYSYIRIHGEQRRIFSKHINSEDYYNHLKKIMIRRLKHEVMAQLPSRFYKNVIFKLSEEEQKIHNTIIETAKELLENGQENELLGALVKAKESCDSLKLIDMGNKSSKLEALKDFLEDYFDEKIIIFTEYAKMAHLLVEELGKDNCILITGNEKDKLGLIKEFKASDKKYLIATDCLNYGVNLEFCNVMIHFDLPWTPARIEQREGRIDRITQKRNMLIIKFISEDTLEQRILEVLEIKKDLFKNAVEGINEKRIGLEALKKL